MKTGASTRPYRIVLGWQLIAIALMAALSAGFSGVDGAISAALGGAVAVAGSLVFMWLLPKQTASTPWDSLGALLRAEGAKVGIIVILLWAVMAVFKKIVVVGFIGTFILAVIIFSMAIFVRNPVSFEMDKNNVG